jgi:hypothetical protein
VSAIELDGRRVRSRRAADERHVGGRQLRGSLLLHVWEDASMVLS